MRVGLVAQTGYGIGYALLPVFNPPAFWKRFGERGKAMVTLADPLFLLTEGYRIG